MAIKKLQDWEPEEGDSVSEKKLTFEMNGTTKRERILQERRKDKW